MQETRGYDAKKEETYSQRIKEEAFDYRYFPEPDIPPLTKKSLAGGEVIESLEDVKKSYEDLGLSENYIKVLLADHKLAEFFAELKEMVPAEESANILINNRFGDPKKTPLKDLVAAYQKQNSRVFLPEEELKSLTEKIILDNPGPVGDYAKGRPNAKQFLFGKLMAAAGGKLDPQLGQKVLKELLDART